MPRSKEISEDMRKKVIEIHQSGKGYKLIAKALGLQKSTIRSIVHKWKRYGTVLTLPRSGRPPKISPTARREIIQEAIKNPCMTARDLQATLASSNIHVCDSTIRRILDVYLRPSLIYVEGGMGLPVSHSVKDPNVTATAGSHQDVKLEGINDSESKKESTTDPPDARPDNGDKNEAGLHTDSDGQNKKRNDYGHNSTATDVKDIYKLDHTSETDVSSVTGFKGDVCEYNGKDTSKGMKIMTLNTLY